MIIKKELEEIILNLTRDMTGVIDIIMFVYLLFLNLNSLFKYVNIVIFGILLIVKLFYSLKSFEIFKYLKDTCVFVTQYEARV